MGGAGDGLPDGELQSAILEAGGGSFNTELDLVWNAIGALLAVVVCSLARFTRPMPSGTG
jgi:hypothetical protein